MPNMKVTEEILYHVSVEGDENYHHTKDEAVVHAPWGVDDHHWCEKCMKVRCVHVKAVEEHLAGTRPLLGRPTKHTTTRNRT